MSFDRALVDVVLGRCHFADYSMAVLEGLESPLHYADALGLSEIYRPTPPLSVLLKS